MKSVEIDRIKVTIMMVAVTLITIMAGIAMHQVATEGPTVSMSAIF